jgi:dihydropteroate synthase
MQGHHAVLIRDEGEAKIFLQEIGVDAGAYKYMLPKAVYRCIKLKNIPGKSALIIKQEMLSKGGEAALKRDVFSLEGSTDILLMGNLKHYCLLIEKLKVQPFGLKNLAAEIQDILDALQISGRKIELPDGKTLKLEGQPLIMGILNLTPDSFYDGGRYLKVEKAVARAREMRAEGADIIDIGGASSRPNSLMIDEEEEMNRILPVLEKLAGEDIIISVDTFRANVARASLEKGAHIINDIGRLQLDPSLMAVLADYQAPVVLMHNRMQFNQNRSYEDLISEIIVELQESIAQAERAGLGKEKIIIDPGIGFGKNLDENRLIIKRLWEFKSLGRPLLLGASRKTFIGQTLGLEVDERLEGSLAVVALGVVNGADIIRVHDVKESKRVAMMSAAVVKQDG